MSLKLLFSGDVSLTGIYRDNVLAGEEIFSSAVKELLAESDFSIVNFEGPATEEGAHLRHDVYVVSPPESIPYLTKRRINVFNLANNHVFDCGVKGYTDTATSLACHRALHFGAGETLGEASSILYLKHKGVCVALIGVCHEEGMVASTTSPGVFCDTEFGLLKTRVAEARRQADWVILNYHGGEEYTRVPMPRRRGLFHRYLKLDIDLIVAHHPHVLQGYERVGKKTIFYSLGNFVFDIPVHRTKAFTDTAALLQLDLSKEEYSFRLVPVKMNLLEGTVDVAAEALTDGALALLDDRSYRAAWLADAHRTLFQPAGVNESERTADGAGPGKQRPRFLKPGFYRTLYSLLRGKNSRPVFLGAAAFLVLRRLGLAGD